MSMDNLTNPSLETQNQEETPTDRNALAAEISGAGSAAPAQAPQGFSMPEKLQGKTPEQIAEMYVNLEKTKGQMANELGEQRRYSQTLTDLYNSGALNPQAQTPTSAPAAPAAPAEIDPVELLENPTSAIEKYLATKAPETSQAEQRIAQLEQQIHKQTLETKHPDYLTIGQSAEFQEWSSATPYRQSLVQQVQAGSMEAADMILTEYKAANPAPQADQSEGITQLAAVSAAGASFEGSAGAASGAGSAAPTGKIYNKVDVQRLMTEQPDVYQSPEVQKEIVKAFAEGRVR